MESVEADTSSAAEQKRTYDTAFLRGRGLWAGEYSMVGTGCSGYIEVQCAWRSPPSTQHPTPPPTQHPPVPLEGAQRHRGVPHVVQVGGVVGGAHRQLVAGAGAPAHRAHVGLGVHLGEGGGGRYVRLGGVWSDS